MSAGPLGCSRPAMAAPSLTRNGRGRAMPTSSSTRSTAMMIWSARPPVTSSRPRIRVRPGSISARLRLSAAPATRASLWPSDARPQCRFRCRQPRRIHLCRHRNRRDLRHSKRRRQLDEYLRRLAHRHGRTAVQEIITDPARGSHDAYAVTDERRLLHGQLHRSPNARPGSTSPAASINWPIPSSARAMPPRPTPTPFLTTWPSFSIRSRPTGTTRSPIIPLISLTDITRSSMSPPTRAFTCRPPTVWRLHEPGLDFLPRHDIRRVDRGRRICLMSTSPT